MNSIIKKNRIKKQRSGTIIHYSFALCAILSIFTTIAVILVLCTETAAFFSKVSFSDFFLDTEWTPLFIDKHFGVWPLVFGTALVSSIAMIAAIPTGLITAIYLSEYAPERMRRAVKPILEVLAGIPTVVYGYFALLFVTPLLQKIIPPLSGFNALSPGIVMGIMIMPMVSSLSEDALYNVPGTLRDAAYALGSSRLQVTLKVVFPAAFSGISAACILAISRAIGETMIVTIAAGQQPNLTLNPLQSVEAMTAYIVQVSLGDTPHGTIEYETIFAIGAMLFTGTFILNTVSHWLKTRFREDYE